MHNPCISRNKRNRVYFGLGHYQSRHFCPLMCLKSQVPVKQEQWLLWQRKGRGPNIHAWNQLTLSLQLPLRPDTTLAIDSDRLPVMKTPIPTLFRDCLCYSVERKCSISGGDNWILTLYYKIFIYILFLFYIHISYIVHNKIHFNILLTHTVHAVQLLLSMFVSTFVTCMGPQQIGELTKADMKMHGQVCKTH